MKRSILFLLPIIVAVNLTSCLKSIFKEATSESIEIGAEKSMLKLTKEVSSEVTEKALLKAVSKGAVAELSVPVGKKTLEVIESKTFKGKFYPAINNLGILSEQFPKEFNSKILIERRKAISPYMQFLTSDNITKINPEKLALGYPSNAKYLKHNMLISMDPPIAKINNAFGGADAHHIIEGTDPAAALSRDILNKFNIDINHPINGILLPKDRNSIYKGTLHKTSHTKEYSEYVYQKIKKSKSKDELIKSLTDIKYDLYNGKIKLEGALHTINKNDINI